MKFVKNLKRLLTAYKTDKLELETNMAQPDITIYSSKFCGFCVAAERLLQNKDLEYKIIKVDEDPSKFEHMVKITGRRTVPQIFIGDHHVGGFDDLSAANQSGELKKLLESA